MFKLAVLAAILAVAVAAPGGLTGITLSHGIGPIRAPAVAIAAAPAYGAHVIAQPAAPQVAIAPIVTRTVLPAAHGAVALPLANGLHG